MHIRATKRSELELIQHIYSEARKYMRENGNHQQWVNGYPSNELLIDDIQEGSSYICLDGAEIVGVFTFTIGEDPTYQEIYHGKWINDTLYGVVHRLGALRSQKGVGAFCLEWCFQQIPNIKVDTHEDNVPMQKMLVKNGYRKCGTIYVNDGTPRVAFQKASHN